MIGWLKRKQQEKKQQEDKRRKPERLIVHSGSSELSKEKVDGIEDFEEFIRKNYL